MTATSCAACGEALRPAARFCGACGTPSPAGPAAAVGEHDPNDTVIIATPGGNLSDPGRTVITGAGPAGTAPGTDPAPADPGSTTTGAALPPLGPPPPALVVGAKAGSRPPAPPPGVAPPPGPPPAHDPHGAPPAARGTGPSTAFIVAGVAVIALLVIGLVVALSRSGGDAGDAAPEFTDTGASADQASGAADTGAAGGAGSADDSSTSPSTVADSGGSSIPSGPSRTIEPARVAAPLQTEPSVNGCDQTTTFEPANLLDHTPETAWRTAGDGTGRRITLNLGVDTRVTSVGLINGYAKVDPCDGTDRYFQGRRVTAVRWTFDDGTEVVQDLDEGVRSVQSTAVDVVTLRVQLEILGTTAPGERDFTPISDIEIEGVT